MKCWGHTNPYHMQKNSFELFDLTGHKNFGHKCSHSGTSICAQVQALAPKSRTIE